MPCIGRLPQMSGLCATLGEERLALLSPPHPPVDEERALSREESLSVRLLGCDAVWALLALCPVRAERRPARLP